MPVIVMLLAIWFGLLYHNKRLDDFKDLFRAELRAEILASEKRILQAMAEMRTELRAEMAEMRTELKADIEAVRADIAALDRRVQRLEAPLLRT